MDFTDRSLRQPQQPTSNQPSENNSGSGKKPGRWHRIKNHRLLNITYITLLFSVTVLIVGIVILLSLFDGNRNGEEQFVDTGKYQAVFLNGGQVYFGKITNLNSDYLTLSDIYYLTPNQATTTENSSSSNNFTIRKLGCELHRPQDAMVINNAQVMFWENLKSDSSTNTVPGAIKQLSTQTQNCDQQSQTPASSTTPSSSSTTPAKTTPSSTPSSSSDNSSSSSNTKKQ